MIARELLNKLADRTTSEIYDGFVITFTDNLYHPELVKYNAAGLSYFTRPGKNLDYLPHSISLREFYAMSGIVSMEMTHSLFYLLGFDSRTSNDVIHWLYNEGKLYTIQWNHPWALIRWGGILKMVVPDIAYGVVNYQEIMEGIRSGRYVEGRDKYWSDPAGAGLQSDRVIATDEHEVEHIKEFIKRKNRTYLQ